MKGFGGVGGPSYLLIDKWRSHADNFNSTVNAQTDKGIRETGKKLRNSFLVSGDPALIPKHPS
jgi:hypothetical protein